MLSTASAVSALSRQAASASTASSLPTSTVNVQSLLSGAGSSTGIDVNTLVTELVASDRAPFDDQIATRQASLSSEVSSLGTVKGALSTFQTAVQSLSTAGAFSPQLANSTNQNIVTASTDGTAASGSYSVEVDALASADQLVSTAFPSGTSSCNRQSRAQTQPSRYRTTRRS